MAKLTREDTFHCRNYVTFYEIADNALKMIEKIEQEPAIGQDFNLTPQPYMNYILFSKKELKIISYDYAFATWENFIEHIGYILFDDWDSNGKQRHYLNKQKKLLCFNEIIERNNPPNLDSSALEGEWCQIINSFNPDKHKDRRNPIKHTHSGNHEVRIREQLSNATMMNTEEYTSLVDGTLQDLTNEQCSELFNEIKEFIDSTHSYIEENKLIFKLYAQAPGQNKKRQALLSAFLTNAYAQPITSSYAKLLSGAR